MLISVIIPVFNGEKYIKECLESVSACPSVEIECIIVNDGSSDGTDEICERFVAEDARFRLISKENSGVSDSRNIGMNAAAGDYIFFLDADDYINTAMWQEILAHAGQGHHDFIAYGYYNLFESGALSEEQFPKDCDVSLALLSTTLLNTCWGKLLRRNIIVENGLGFRRDLRTCEDAVFIIDFVQRAESFALVNDFALYYRIHSGGVMRRTGLADKLVDYAALYTKRKDYLAKEYSETAQEMMYRQQFSVITDLLRAYTEKHHIKDIRREYKNVLKKPVVAEIIANTKKSYLQTSYKKLEHTLLTGGYCTLLAVYFKLKARLK